MFSLHVKMRNSSKNFNLEKEEKAYFLIKVLIDDKEIRALNCKL